MKRRRFLTKSALGTMALGTAGCSALRPKYKLEKKLPDFSDLSFDVTMQKPSGGTMPYGEIGSTGIKVSKFAFGSHISQPLLTYEKERQVMIREAYDLGINLFDIYEKRWNIFQYEPMGRHLAPFIKDVVISIFMDPYDGRTVEQEFERALKLLGRDYIDMVRTYAFSPKDSYWNHWETLFKLKEKGYIRAVGTPMHFKEEIPKLLELHETYPFDYVIFPYNFYHNVIWDGRRGVNFDPMVKKLREKGVGIIVMKPMGSDHLIRSFINAARELDETGEISFGSAALKYVINSGLNPDTTLNGMYTLNHVYENIAVYFNPLMTSEEEKLLEKLRKRTKVVENYLLPEHYKFLRQWAPDYNGDLNGNIFFT